MSKDLFPEPLPVVIITGEYDSGKTLAILTTGYPLERTLLYDNELSAETYARKNHFVRVDLVEELVKKNERWTDADFYLAWKAHAESIKPGQYDVIGIDPIERLESGIAQWVADHPQEFGRSTRQYSSMSGVYWGDVKNQEAKDLLALAAKCKMLIVTAHMRNVYVNKEPTRERERKGKETLSELATLELTLQRKPGQIRPSATINKCRLNYGNLADPEHIRPMFDRYIPEFTWKIVREYMEHGADPDHPVLPPEPDREELEMEKLRLQATIAQARIMEGESGVPEPVTAPPGRTEKCPICGAAAAVDAASGHAPWCKLGPDGQRYSEKA